MFGSYSLQKLHEDIINTQTEIKIDVAYVNQAIIQIQRDVKDLNMLAKTLSDTHIKLNELVKVLGETQLNINEDIKKENLDFYVFAATDIINSNSKIISLGNDAWVVEKAFGVPVDNHTAMLENVVSRKKQILPPILDNLK